MGLVPYGLLSSINLAKMKIAIISFYSGHIERGVENWTYELANRLSRNCKVTVFQTGEEKKKHDYTVVVKALSIAWTQPGSTGMFSRRFFLDYWSMAIAKFTLKLLPALWRENFDIIISTNGGWQPSLIRLLTWIKRSKMVIVGHSGRGWDDRNNLWNFPDVFIALTQVAKDWAKRVNPFVKVEFIPNGIDLKMFNPNGDRLSIKLKKPIVLCAGALASTKRVDLTIRAMVGIKNASLLVVGKGEEEKNIIDLGNKLLGDRFQLINLSYQKMPEVYRVAAVFTLPSWESEAFPLVYLEAMASNLPVVATDDQIRKEIVGDAGILVDPKDTKAYTKALKEALATNWDNKPRKQAEKFSWDKVANQYEKLMLSLLNSK